MKKVKNIFFPLIILLISFLPTLSPAEPINVFTLTSPAFSSQDTIPIQYTCDGEDISPTLSWTGTPEKTAAFALIVSDPDAPSGTFYHWILVNLPNTQTSLDQGIKQFPPQTIIGTNSFSKQQYNGPCPPKGPAHNYVFTLYALNAPLELPTNADAKTVILAMQKHVLNQAEIVATYARK